MVARVIDHPFSAGVIPTPYNPDPALLAIVEIIRAGLIRDQHVRLHQFGTFRLRWSKERRVKHPKTKQSIIVPPAPRITFTPAKQLREWIEPNRKPVIPLNEPLKPKSALTAQQDKDTESAKPVPAPVFDIREHQPQDQPNLRETVEDIIDEEFSPPESPSGIVNTQPDNQVPLQEETSPKETDKSSKKWAVGLLTAVPLIIYLLQADFTSDTPDTTAAPSPSSTTTELQAAVTSDSTNNTVIRTDSIAPVSAQPNVNNETIQSDNVAQVDEQPNVSEEFLRTEDSTPVIEQPSINNEEVIQTETIVPDSTQSDLTSETIQAESTAADSLQSDAYSEPTPNSFYMSPEVHTIQQGENLWNLAKQFYGDALLWPHIYRANSRTLDDPDRILSGKQLVIPGLQQSPESLSTKDSELIAEGYFMVYEFNKMKDSNQAIHFLIGAKQFNFEWLQQKRPLIPRKDWKIISKI